MLNISSHESHIAVLREAAAKCHADVNQTYDGYLPYEFHLRLTASYAERFGHLVPIANEDVETVFAAAYFHDALEDARLTYNDLRRLLRHLNDEHGLEVNVDEAAEAVYALTNDKGRTRSERGARCTTQAYAPRSLPPSSRCATASLTCAIPHSFPTAKVWRRSTRERCPTSSRPSVPCRRRWSTRRRKC